MTLYVTSKGGRTKLRYQVYRRSTGKGRGIIPISNHKTKAMAVKKKNEYARQLPNLDFYIRKLFSTASYYKEKRMKYKFKPKKKKKKTILPNFNFRF